VRNVVLNIEKIRGSAEKIVRENLYGLSALLEGETVWIVDPAHFLKSALTEKAVKNVLEDCVSEEALHLSETDQNQRAITGKLERLRFSSILIEGVQSSRTGKRGWKVQRVAAF